MHIPGHRVSPQVSLLNVKPVTAHRCQRRTVPRRSTQAVIRAHSVADPLTLFSPSKVAMLILMQLLLQIWRKPDTLPFVQINLFLRIVGKRPDGYHDLASLFHVSPPCLVPRSEACSFDPFVKCMLSQVIDLGDTMTFSAIPGQADALSCNMPGVPLDDSNLVIKVCPPKRVASTSITTYRFGQHPVIRHYTCADNKQGGMLSVAPPQSSPTPFPSAGPEAVSATHWLITVLPSTPGEEGPTWYALNACQTAAQWPAAVLLPVKSIWYSRPVLQLCTACSIH